MSNDDFEKRNISFLAWLNKMGIKMSSKMALVDLRSAGRRRGIVAMGDFEEDELVFSIPRATVLNNRTAVPNISSMTPEMLENMPSWLRRFNVVRLPGCPSSKLDSLAFWSAAELQELQASAVLNKVGKATAEALFREKILALGIKGASVRIFHSMASTIMAYAFDIPENDLEESPNEDDHEELILDDDKSYQRTIMSIVPLADMLNADADLNNARLSCDKLSLEMRTIKPILKGEEILNDYGPLPRSDLLRRYGYITENYSGYDVAEISANFILSTFQHGPAFDSQVAALEPLGAVEVDDRLELARREDIFDESYDITRKSFEGTCLPDELIALLYLLLIDNDALNSIKRSGTHLPRRPRMETRLLGQVLEAILRRRYQEYTTTLEEDEEMLRAESHQVRKIMAIKVRHGEKAVLLEAMVEATSFQGSNEEMRINSGKRGMEQMPKSHKRSRHR